MPRHRPFQARLPLLLLLAACAWSLPAAASEPTPAEHRRLAAGETVVRMATGAAVEGWAAREIAVPAERVARAVGDWRHYAEFFPFVERSAAAVDDGAVVTRQKLDPPGLAPRREVVAIARREGPAEAGEDGGGPRTWRFRWRGRSAADAADGGEWTIVELAPGRTRVELRLTGGLGLPAGLARTAVERTLPWVLDGLAQHVNRCRYDLPVHPTCAEELPPAPAGLRAVAAARQPPEIAALAARLPPGLHLGTSTWSFPGWAGLVYARPATASTLAQHGLAAYAEHPLLNAAGIDRTHYEPLTADDFAAYAAQVPAGFRFVVKAHEALTVARWPDHPRYGDRRGEANPLFLDAAYAAEAVIGPTLAGLGDKAGVLVFQLAPQDLGVVERFVDELAAFLLALPTAGPDGRRPLYAVELRNREVLGPRYAAALAAAGAIHCVNRHPRMPDVDVQARQVGAVEAPAFLCRWMLHPTQTYPTAQRRYEPYDRLVDEDPATRRALADLALAVTARGRPAYVIANNNAEGSSPLTLLELARRIAAQRTRRP